MIRRSRCGMCAIGVLAAAVLAHGGAVWAGEAAAAAGELPARPEISQPVPLTPPPGISIMPSPPRMVPPQAEDQVPGCPARNLKPLDLLV